TYYTFAPSTGTGTGGITGSATTRLRKTGATYYIKVEDIVTSQTTLSGYESILLKDDLPVGGTWTSSYSQTSGFADPNLPTFTMDTQITGTIEEKGITLTVGDETFTDVIKTKYLQNVTM